MSQLKSACKTISGEVEGILAFAVMIYLRPIDDPMVVYYLEEYGKDKDIGNQRLDQRLLRS